MVSTSEFCERLVGDFKLHFRRMRSVHLLTQSIASCNAIIEACLDINPDYVLDIGTNYGLSTLSLAQALKLLGKDLSVLTTTDIDHSHWLNETPEIQKGLLLNSEICTDEIHAVCSDFMDLDPGSMIRPGKVLVFYDIHDSPSVSMMGRFLEQWLPRFTEGYVMVHDFYLAHSGYWIDRDVPECPVSTAEHFSGHVFEGFKECRVLIEWMNSIDKHLRVLEGVSVIGFDL